MNDIAAELYTKLNETTIAFTIPIFGGIPVPESVVITWGIMAVLVLFSIIFVRNLKLAPSGMQVYLETFIGWINNFFTGILGEGGKRYIPYLGTVLLYIGCSNIVGLFGLTPPTKDLNVTAGLAIMSIVLVEAAGIKAKGAGGWIKGFAQPMAFMTPLNVLEIVIKPLSLCMRLFGNVLGSFVIMELIKMVIPVFVPLAFSFYFDIFDGLLQAYVFVFLTSLYIQEVTETE